jgi:hypothetical protein
MKQTIHDTPGFRLEIAASQHPISGPTIELFSTWPKANHPDPHRLLSLTLPPESLRQLAKVLARVADEADGIAPVVNSGSK